MYRYTIFALELCGWWFYSGWMLPLIYFEHFFIPTHSWFNTGQWTRKNAIWGNTRSRTCRNGNVFSIEFVVRSILTKIYHQPLQAKCKNRVHEFQFRLLWDGGGWNSVSRVNDPAGSHLCKLRGSPGANTTCLPKILEEVTYVRGAIGPEGLQIHQIPRFSEVD